MSPLFSSTRFTRRRFGLAIPAGLALLGPGTLGRASAQDDDQEDEGEDQGVPIISTRTGDVPSTGGARPGPAALDPGPVARATGVRPIALQVESIGISAEIEQLNIVDGIMQDPTGPWVVSWYEETAGLDQIGNLVAAGHINYWNVGDAVFANIDDLQEGDLIVFTGEDEAKYTYAVQWTQLVEVATMDTDTLQDLVGPTDAENVTLITCGGEFDYNTGEYLSRTVVRGERVPPETDENTGSDGDDEDE
jgi:LPXTG-site transpeptidase (sortase) family protein